MSNTVGNGYYAACKPLLELATPRIYRRNLFRVLGLSVQASSREAQRQQNRRAMQERLGVESSDGVRGPLGLNPAPTEDEIRSAMERLNRPVDRLLDEIFWFWPLNGKASEDPPLRAIAEGRVREAEDLWKKEAELNRQEAVATHNLAVLYHVLVLDHEVDQASGSVDENGSKQPSNRGSLSQLWTGTIKGFFKKNLPNPSEELWLQAFAGAATFCQELCGPW